MNKEIIKSSLIGEEYIKIKHKSGLTICLYPMEKYSTAVAIFGAKYGSVDTTFKTNKDTDYVTVPEGIAHYLEHKLFENDDCDAMELFSRTGASPNAFTTFDRTAYHFTCTDKFGENLRILLDFVQNPYFTDESVEKERGIIAQEIKGYLDDPGWRVFFNGLGAIYHNNPVRIDIAGTVDSIKQINKELLYRCYNTFYNLNNMVLSIAGNFDVDEALAICDEMLKPSEDIELSAIVPDEPYEVKEKRVSQKLYCAVPLFQLGFKMPAFEGKERIRNDYIYSCMLDTAIGCSTEFFNKHYSSGLINTTFSTGVFKGRGFFLPLVSGESPDPDKLCEEIIGELNRLKKDGLSKEDFEINKKTSYGSSIYTFNSVSSVAGSILSTAFLDFSAYEIIDIIAGITYDDAMNALQSLDTDNHSLSVIEPISVE